MVEARSASGSWTPSPVGRRVFDLQGRRSRRGGEWYGGDLLTVDAGGSSLNILPE